MEYKFVKQVLDSDLQSDLASSGLTGITATLSGNLITFTTDRVLNTSDMMKLRSLVEGLYGPVPNYDNALITINEARSYGSQLISEFAAENVALGLTASQVAYIAAKYAPFVTLLMSGSLKTALTTLESMPTDPVIGDDRKRKFLNKIRKFLGIPLENP